MRRCGRSSTIESCEDDFDCVAPGGICRQVGDAGPSLHIRVLACANAMLAPDGVQRVHLRRCQRHRRGELLRGLRECAAVLHRSNKEKVPQRTTAGVKGMRRGVVRSKKDKVSESHVPGASRAPHRLTATEWCDASESAAPGRRSKSSG